MNLSYRSSYSYCHALLILFLSIVITSCSNRKRYTVALDPSQRNMATIALPTGQKIFIEKQTNRFLRFPAFTENDYVSGDGNYYSWTINEGEKQHLGFPDSSQIWLNSGTKFRLPVEKDKKETNSFLEGEAFFDLRDSSTLFTVHLADGWQVTGKGGAFSVTAYPENPSYEVSSKDSKLIIKNGDFRMDLSPGRSIWIDKSNSHIRNLDRTPFFVGNWTRNGLGSDGETLYDVSKRVGRWYRKKIDYTDSLPPEYAKGDIISDMPLDSALLLINKTFDIHAKAADDKIVISPVKTGHL